MRVSRCLTLTGKIVASAGNKNIEKKNAAITPIAATLPKSLKGGASLVFNDRKPIAVVTDVKKTGMKFTRKLSLMADFLSLPARISVIHVDKT